MAENNKATTYQKWITERLVVADTLSRSSEPKAMELARFGTAHEVDNSFHRIFYLAPKLTDDQEYDFSFAPWLPKDLKHEFLEKLGVSEDLKLELVYPENKTRYYANQNSFIFSTTKWENVIYVQLEWFGEGTGGSKEYLLFNTNIQNAEQLRKVIRGET